MKPFERLVKTIEENFDRKENGGHNFIPVGFDRFEEYFPGMIKSSYTIWTASSGIGKSKLSRFICINQVLKFVKENPKIKPTIVVFSLELSAEEYIADILASKLHADYGININYRELISITTKKEVLNRDIINKIKGYDDWMNDFYTYVRIYGGIKNPYGIYKKCVEIIRQTIKGKEEIDKDDEDQDIKYWQYEDDNCFMIPIIDPINLIHPERDKESGKMMTKHEAISKLSNIYLLDLKNYYRCHVNVVQQQAADKERVESNYMGKTLDNKLFPSLDGLGDNKLTQRDADSVVGIFAPARYEIESYLGYDITALNDNIRFIKLLKSRYSTPNKPIALFFNGSSGDFEELPKPEECTTNVINALLKKWGKETVKFRINE